MIILPEKRVIVVATPRTGSRALNAAIIASGQKKSKVTREHHDWIEDVSRAASGGEGGKFEIWTMIREPLSQLQSWLGHCQHWHDVPGFIKQNRFRWFAPNGQMNYYHEIATRLFIFENHGHQEMLDELGIDVPLLHIGGSQSKAKRDFTDHEKRLAYDKFRLDFDLYDHEVEEQSKRRARY